MINGSFLDLDSFDNTDPRILTVLVIGTEEKVQSYIWLQQQNGFASVGDWSRFLPVPNCPGKFIASAIANVSIPGFLAAQDVAEGAFTPGMIRQIGLEVPEAVSLALSSSVTPEIQTEIEALSAKIVSGEIKVSTEYNESEFEA